jgi:hypothetical protein
MSHGPFGILDLGASQTVIGKQQVQEVLQGLPAEVAKRVQKVPCDTIFRFGKQYGELSVCPACASCSVAREDLCGEFQDSIFVVKQCVSYVGGSN